jgi:hypothetical protein
MRKLTQVHSTKRCEIAGVYNLNSVLSSSWSVETSTYDRKSTPARHRTYQHACLLISLHVDHWVLLEQTFNIFDMSLYKTVAEHLLCMIAPTRNKHAQNIYTARNVERICKVLKEMTMRSMRIQHVGLRMGFKVKQKQIRRIVNPMICLK